MADPGGVLSHRPSPSPLLPQDAKILLQYAVHYSWKDLDFVSMCRDTGAEDNEVGEEEAGRVP
jgi:hypothetical protein